MGKDIYLFEKVIFKDFKYSTVMTIHSQEELRHIELLKIHLPNTLRYVNAENQKQKIHL